MRFRNDIHKRRFEKEIKTMDKKNNAQIRRYNELPIFANVKRRVL